MTDRKLLTEFDLDPEIESFIETMLRVSSNLSIDSSVEQQRESTEAACRYFSRGYPDKVEASNEKVDSRHGKIKIRRYHYDEVDPDSDTQIVFIHGGGFILGNLDSQDDTCAELCAATGLNTVSLDYRKAPEFLYPVHIDDITDGYLETWRTNSILVGVSAGANLAAALCHRLKTSDKRPTGQVLIYPALGGDLFNLESYTTNANAPLLSIADIQYYRQIRCKDGVIPQGDPEFYPLVAIEFSGLPPTVAFSADVDPLRDDSRLYVEKLNQAGVDAVWHNEMGLVHSYLWARHTSRKAGDGFQRIIGAIKKLAR